MSTERRASLFQTLSSLTDAVLLCRVSDRWSNLPASLLETKLGRVITSVSDYTLTAADCGAIFVSSKTSTLNLFLPPATVGLRYTVYLRSSYRVQIDPQAGESLTHPTTGALAAAGKYIWADLSGECLTLCCVAAGEWALLDVKGTWTLEA